MNIFNSFHPSRLIEKIALANKQRKRLGKLKKSVAKSLKPGHIDSLELLELILMTEPELQNVANIYDIGSNIGTWTLLVKSLFPQAEVHAFEPLEVHANAFNHNCHKLTGVHLHRFCLGNKEGSGVMNVSSYSDASSLLQATDLEFREFGIKKIGEQPVEIKRLRDLIDAEIVPLADIVKLDIQGYELEALKGIGEHLHAVKFIICEVSLKQYYIQQAQFLDIANYLAGFNFQLFAFGENTPVGRELHQIDVLFVNKR